MAEIGLGFRYVALVHMLGHACLRTLQFVRAPSLLARLPHDRKRHRAAPAPCRGLWDRRASAVTELAVSKVAGAGLPRPGIVAIRRSRRSCGRFGGATLWNGAGPISSRARRRASQTRSSLASERSKSFHERPALALARTGDCGRAGRFALGQPVCTTRIECTALASHSPACRSAAPCWHGWPSTSACRASPSSAGALQRSLFGRQIFGAGRAERSAVADGRTLALPDGVATSRMFMRRYFVLVVDGRRGNSAGDVQLQRAVDLDRRAGRLDRSAVRRARRTAADRRASTVCT